MAKKTKTTKIIKDTVITITPKSKNNVYEFTSNATFTINNQTKGYNEKYYTIPIKQGNDLIIDTIYTTSSNAKVITTTFKNYFANTSAQYKINFEGYWLWTSYKDTYEITPSIDENELFITDANTGRFGIGTNGNDIHNLLPLIIYDKKGNDTYINGVSGTERYTTDLSGNDTHISLYSDSLSRIDDYNGNDKYSAEQGRISATDYKGNDTYTASEDGRLYVSDYGGKDTYTIRNTKYSNISDLGKGNDAYDIANCYTIDKMNDFNIWDKYGNETYNITNLVYNSDNFYPYAEQWLIEDENGKDTYNIKGVGYAKFVDMKGNDKITIKNSETIYFTDYNGNDTWKLERTDNLHSLDEIYIYDENGKDNYTITGVDGFASIHDKAGNDKYTMNGNSNGAEITDEKGNDKYTVKDGSKIFTITDNNGKDKYNILGTTDKYIDSFSIYDYGYKNDKYTINYANGYNAIYDDGGKDSYDILNCSSLKINDYSGNDKYNIKATETLLSSVVITDDSGKDKYSLKGTYNKKTKATTYLNSATIVDDGSQIDTYNLQYTRKFNITDNGGNEKYNIKSGYGAINDNGGNDTYTISKTVSQQGIFIDDKGGSKDTLKLTDVNKNKIVFMANVGESGLEDNSLILYNKSNGSYVKIEDFFTRAADGDISGYGAGRIETMKAGSKKLSVDYNYINQVRQAAATFLSTGDTIADVLQDQNNNTDTITNLIACFTKK